MKLSKTMQETLDYLINAPYADYENLSSFFYLNDRDLSAPGGYGKYADGTICCFNASGTLKALEKRGLIEIVELGNNSPDVIRLLQHENTNRSIFEDHNLVKVDIYLINSLTGRAFLSNGTYFTEDGNTGNVRRYYEARRWTVAQIVASETGEELYKA